MKPLQLNISMRVDDFRMAIRYQDNSPNMWHALVDEKHMFHEKTSATILLLQLIFH